MTPTKRALTRRSWKAMMARAYRPSNVSFKYVGGRGLGVCERWHSFEAFRQDMGERPGLEFSIDRIDGSKGYFPGNCRWATKQQQARNRFDNRKLTAGGETRLLIEWAELMGIHADTIRTRLAKGWSEEEAVSPHRIARGYTRDNPTTYPVPPHGTKARYESRKHRCRCDVCRAGYAAYQAKRPGRRLPPGTPRRKPDLPTYEHGTVSRYWSRRFRCRCDECKAAYMKYAERFERKR